MSSIQDRIKYPFATLRATGQLVYASNVENGSNCGCYCNFCKEDMIAVNNEGIKCKPHFKHKSNSTCKVDYESFIHWAAKEVFKTLKSIQLPPIEKLFTYNEDIYRDERTILKELGIGRFNVTRERVFQESILLEFDNCEVEKLYHTRKGDIRPDIVVLVKGGELLIEPFNTNPIDEEKLNKIRALDKSTISIDLRAFAYSKAYIFTLQELADFLSKDTKHKEWVYISTDKERKLRDKYIYRFRTQLSANIDMIKQLKDYEVEIEDNYKQIVEYASTYYELKQNRKDLLNAKSEIEKNLGIKSSEFEL